MPIWVALSGRLTVGTLTGYMMGNFLKQISDEIILYTGLGMTFIGGLHYLTWVTINWRNIDRDLLNVVNRSRKSAIDSGLCAKFKRLVLSVLPFMGGFVAGFKYGWE